MKKEFKVLATVLMAGVLFGFAACKTESGEESSADTSTITLNWSNPTDSDFGHVEICYTTNADGTSNSEKNAFETITATETTKTYSNIDSAKAYYIFYLVSVDKLGNKGYEKSCAVVVNKDSIKIPFGFVQVPAASIKGTETWSPSSSVFVSSRALTIASFYMCDYEVTQEEFNDVMGTNPSKAGADGDAGNNPVNCVNWYAAIAYCNKLSIKDGLDPCYTVTGITDWEKLKYSSIPTKSDATWSAQPTTLLKMVIAYQSKPNGNEQPAVAKTTLMPEVIQ